MDGWFYLAYLSFLLALLHRKTGYPLVNERIISVCVLFIK